MEDVFESSVVFLQDGIFCGEVQRVVPFQSVSEAALGKLVYALVGVVHRKSDASLPLEFEHFGCFRFAVFALENHLEGSWLAYHEIGGSVLITKGVSADHDRLLPARNVSWHVFDYDRLSEDSSV